MASTYMYASFRFVIYAQPTGIQMACIVYMFLSNIATNIKLLVFDKDSNRFFF